MRSKRLLSVLLSVCLLVSVLSPAVYAVAPVEDSYIGSSAASKNETAKTEASPFENDKIITSEDMEKIDSMNLRDDPMLKPEVKEAETGNGSWTASKVDGKTPELDLPQAEVPAHIAELKEAAEIYAENDVVTAFVVMEDKPLAERYSSIGRVTALDEEKLLQIQDSIIAMIEKFVLGGKELDVRYQFTYLTNAFSVMTEFGNLSEIAMMDGVKSVYLMPVYHACAVNQMDPLTASSGVMTGVPTVWEELDYRGEGMKIAIIDTGLDLDHPSFAEHDDFQVTDSSLTVEKIDAVLSELNAYELRNTIAGKTLYRSAKVPYAFNYVDENLTADHSADVQGDHGTHVAGIAAANDNVAGTSVVGMAPEAQLVVMKVFGANGGAYTDDIIAALEDAMTLGCDVANLSLGAPAGFTSENEEIDAIYARIAEQDMVVCISAGNEGTSSYSNMWGTDMNTTANPDVAAVGSPGTYRNVTTVASVDNAVVMTPYFSVGENRIFYMDPYEYMITMPEIIDWYGDTYEYVVVDGLGEEENFYDAEGNSLVEGKIAVIRRGELSFGTKITNAEYAGAVAAIIWNNAEEDIFSFGMQISDDGETYPGIPACLISVTDGQKLADAEDKTIVLSATPGERGTAAGGQMSSFSSWGMAPDLTLEPDIAGVGGNVYSCYDGGNYGLMSGTSMSSPQVAGVAALVMQYLHEKFPEAETGALRDMAEALMMSNAEVIISSDSGVEVSPRQQGAGLVNAASAVSTESYLTVNGAKPKVSMGDSAKGVYTFSFEVHNFGEKTKVYTPDASVLTEAVAGAQLSETEVVYFMYGMEQELTADVSFSKNMIMVRPGETVEVEVTITLSEEDKAFFDAAYPNGGYVEGYIYLNSLDEAGMNLPFLGFYGDWTEPPVFDSAFWYDNTFWGAAPVNGIPEGNEYYHVMWTSLPGTDWVLGFNPYTGNTFDENGNVIYDPAHNVVSPNGDGAIDGLDEIYLSLMRNAKTLTITYTNADTGEVLSEEVITNARKTMFQSSYGQIVPWIYSWYGMGMYDFTDAEGNYLPNNTKVLLTFEADVDYGNGGNHTIQIPITVDTEAPELLGEIHHTENGNLLTLTVTDNVALADVFVMNNSGTQIWAEQSVFTRNEDGSYEVTIDVTGLGNSFTVILCDYGANESQYEITYQNEDAGDNLPQVDTTKLYGYRVYDNYIYSEHMYGWISMDKPASAEEPAFISVHTDDYMEYAAINAAEYVDGKLFAVDAVYNLVIMTPGLWDRTTVANLGVNVLDMTFDDSTDTMYVLAKDGDYAYLCTMDLLTGELTMLYDYGYYFDAPYGIADDDNGTLYAIMYGSSGLYTLNEAYEPVAMTDAEGNKFALVDSYGNALNPNYAQGLTYDDGILYWAYFTSSWRGETSELICINVADLTVQSSLYASMAYDENGEIVEYYPITELAGLHTLNDTDYQIPASDTLIGMWTSESRLVLNEGEHAKIKANPVPWNYELTNVVWTSSDDTVATVDANGNITAVSEGNAIITASVGEITAQCVVTVVDVDGNFYAYNYYSGDGNYGYMIDVDMGTMNYSLTEEAPADFYAADYNGHDGYYYGYTEGGQFWRFDLESGEAVKLGEPVGVNPADMAYDYSTGLMYAAVLDYNYGCSYICAVNLSNGELMPLVEVYDYLMTLACDMDGNVYSIGAYGDLHQFDMTTGEDTIVISGLGELQYMQSMCYDHVNDVILWTYPEYSQVYWIDVKDENPYAISLGDPTDSGLIEFVGMYTIPSVIPALVDVAVDQVTAQDMLILAGVEKVPAISVLPFNATCQSAELVSSDKNVVQVTENGTLLGIGEGTATVTYKLKDTVLGQTFEGSFQVTVLEPADDVYGHVLTDLASMGGQYWARLYAVDPSNPDVLASTEYIIYAEEVVDGKLYAYGYDPNDWTGNWQLFVMDPVTQVVENQLSMGEGFPFVYDMTYDYATSTMYALAGPSDNASDIYVVDMETGELILLMQTDEFFMNIAATDKGIFLMEPSVAELDEDGWETGEYTNATIYKFDPVARTTQVLNDTGVKNNMLSSMAYDYDTGYLYWTPMFQGGSYVSSLSIIDPATGAVSALGTVGASGAQISGLYILSENIPAEAEPALLDLMMIPGKTSVTAGQSAQLSARTLPLKLDAQITWSSSDESVATVDENGVVTGIAQGKVIVTATATFNGVTKTAACEVAVLNAEAAFLTYNITDGRFAAIMRSDMSVVKPVTVSEEIAVSAITNAGDVVYGYDVDNNLFTLDTATFQRTVIGQADAEQYITDYLVNFGGYTDDQVAAELDLYAFEVRDLAYDVANSRLLALGNVYDREWGELNGGNGIYEVDLKTGELKLLYIFQDIYSVMAIAADENGLVYNYNAYDDYYSVLDLTTGVNKRMVSLQSQSYYGSTEDSHTLYFDQLTGLVYHLFTSNGTCYKMFTMDPASGNLAMESEYVGEVIYDEELWTDVGDCFTGLCFVEMEIPEICDHELSASFAWAEDYSSCTATVVCANCDYTETAACQVEVTTTPATCVSEGKVVHTAVYGDYTDSVEVVIAATGIHDFEDGVCTGCGKGLEELVENPFKDVDEDAYYFLPVLWAVEKGITAGTTADTFSPNMNCTRAQVVAFLWRAAGCPEPVNGKNPFKDVKEDAYYYDAVLWAAEEGIVAGYTADKFCPDYPCTRAQVVTFLWRAAGRPESENGKNPFKDVKADCYYYDAVVWAVENGITAGITANTFAPDLACTRAQVVSFLYRAD